MLLETVVFIHPLKKILGSNYVVCRAETGALVVCYKLFYFLDVVIHNDEEGRKLLLILSCVDNYYSYYYKMILLPIN